MKSSSFNEQDTIQTKSDIWFLKVAEKHNICFKQSKYDFNTKEIPILEVVVEQGELQMENTKVKVVKE